nr:calcium-binding protein [Polymorphobacter sp.]
MTIILDVAGAIVSNDVNVTGAPAFRITGNDIRFINSETGRIRADTDTDSAIVLLGSGITIINAAGGIIRTAADSFNTQAAPVILGSSGADRIEDSGTIIGKVELGGGNDVFQSLSGDSAWNRTVNLGEGDDSFFLLPTTSISLAPVVDGGPGIDRYISLAGTGNFDGPQVTNIEILELRSDSFVESFRGTELVRVEIDFTAPTRVFNALRFFDTPNADIVILEVANGFLGGLSVYDRSTIRSLTGSDFVDQISIANDTVLPGAIALGGGDDFLTISRSQFSNPLQTRIGSIIDGGTGFDRFSVQLRNGAILELGHVANFEALSVFNAGPNNGEPQGEGVILRGVGNFAEFPIYQGSLVTLEASNVAGGAIELWGRSRLNIAADTIVAAIKTGGSFGNPQLADDTQSVTVVNQGRITGLVQFGVGDDVLDGANSLAALVAIGGAGNDRLTGGAFDDRLEGGLGGDTLIGGGGNDSLDGGAAADTLDGGSGNDRLSGGTGNDSYVVDSQADLIFENPGEGTDSVTASTGFYLYANVENLTLDAAAGDIFGVGNDLGNTITGNGGSNLLIGGAGDDIIFGDSGIDALFGETGDDSLNGGAGIDYIVGGAGNDVVSGNADADALYGEDGDDLLIGGADFQTDILVGGNGNDLLNANSGLGDYDLIDGGAGDDTYLVDTPADLTFEALNGGTDTVRANINGAGYYLYANTENLILDGQTPFGVGNELANQLTGNAISNYLLGGAGNDTLNGKAGNDVLFGESGADTFIFERGTGGDVIGDFQAGVDKISLTGLGFTSYAQLQANFVEVAGTTAINLGQGDFIVLNGVTNAALTAADFILG